MTDSTWTNQNQELLLEKPRRRTSHLVLVAILLLGAVGFVIYNAFQSGGAQLYLTVNEYLAEAPSLTGRDVRVSGWVVGDSIQYTQISADESRLEFDIVDDLSNPQHRLRIVAMNEPKPDLLQHEAQALVEGHGDGSGAFLANKDGLLLKCPTRYEGDQPILAGE